MLRIGEPAPPPASSAAEHDDPQAELRAAWRDLKEARAELAKWPGHRAALKVQILRRRYQAARRLTLIPGSKA